MVCMSFPSEDNVNRGCRHPWTWGRYVLHFLTERFCLPQYYVFMCGAYAAFTPTQNIQSPIHQRTVHRLPWMGKRMMFLTSHTSTVSSFSIFCFQFWTFTPSNVIVFDRQHPCFGGLRPHHYFVKYFVVSPYYVVHYRVLWQHQLRGHLARRGMLFYLPEGWIN